MDVNSRNNLFLKGEIDRDDLWPKIVEYRAQPRPFRFQFGLDELPREPGVLIIRGPRQYGKSTWLEYELLGTLEDFGPGTAFFINGEDHIDDRELEQAIDRLIDLFATGAVVRRIFIDEASAVDKWEMAIKRLADRGRLKNILVVTTGSNAADLRRGAERLPGRKGRLSRTEYIFTGISFKDFYTQFKDEIPEHHLWVAYMFSGGSPIAAKELWQFEKIPEYFKALTRDWVFGSLLRSGRARPYVIRTLRGIFKHATSRCGYLNLAKSAGLANNTIAAEYIEQFSDLLSVIPSLQWDSDKHVPLQKKPCKFHFINLSVPLAFSQNQIDSQYDFRNLNPTEQSHWLEWLVAQELFRRQCIRGSIAPESIYYWASKQHEIDFVDENENFYEVKLGNVDLTEFSWFPKIFPNKKLLVISGTERNGPTTEHIKVVHIEDFLLADGFPHPYPGMVDDIDIFNDRVKW